MTISHALANFAPLFQMLGLIDFRSTFRHQLMKILLHFHIFVTHEIHQEKGEEKKEISMKIANLISYSWQPQKIGVTVEITIAVFRHVFLLLSLS